PPGAPRADRRGDPSGGGGHCRGQRPPGRSHRRRIRPPSSGPEHLLKGGVQMAQAEIGIFGGSGFYTFLDDVEEVWVETPYGPPSDRVALAQVAGRRVAFLPRHGKDHRLPPHPINYRAALRALMERWVTGVSGPCAEGGLEADIGRGDWVVTDECVNRTWGREDTFYEGPVATHLAAAEPYGRELRSLAVAAAKEVSFRS